MEANIQIFSNPQFGQIRTANNNGEPAFCLADLCRVLNLRTDGVFPRLKKDGYNLIGVTDSLGRDQQTYFINEQNLYKVIMRSDKNEAVQFQDWVCGEILPAIRKHGGYLTSQKVEEALLNPDTLIQLATNLKEERQRRQLAESKASLLEEVTREQAPKVQYYNTVLISESNYITNQIASELGISAITLNKKLKEKKVQYKLNGQWLLYAEYRDKGYTKTNTYPYPSSDGSIKTSMQTVWTEKGREFIHKMLNQ